jgi:hypothetical protein
LSFLQSWPFFTIAALAGAAETAESVEIAKRATAAVVSTLRIRTSVGIVQPYKNSGVVAKHLQANSLRIYGEYLGVSPLKGEKR